MTDLNNDKLVSATILSLLIVNLALNVVQLAFIVNGRKPLEWVNLSMGYDKDTSFTFDVSPYSNVHITSYPDRANVVRVEVQFKIGITQTFFESWDLDTGTDRSYFVQGSTMIITLRMQEFAIVSLTVYAS